jgi:hypothetical protein
LPITALLLARGGFLYRLLFFFVLHGLIVLRE